MKRDNGAETEEEGERESEGEKDWDWGKATREARRHTFAGRDSVKRTMSGRKKARHSGHRSALRDAISLPCTSTPPCSLPGRVHMRCSWVESLVPQGREFGWCNDAPAQYAVDGAVDF